MNKKIATVYRMDMAFKEDLGDGLVRFTVGDAVFDVTYDWWRDAGFPKVVTVAVEVEE